MTSQGPLGNKQVRVEDFLTIQSGSAGAVGTSAVNTVTVNASAGGVPAGAYFTFSTSEPLLQEAQSPVQRYHVWYSKDSAVDPLPKESNNRGIKVIIASTQATDVVASNTVVAIESFFSGKPPAISVSATRSGNDVVITNRTVGPARTQDGTGSRGAVAASTGFAFASTTPGVRPDILSFTLASTTEGSTATGGSILNIIPFVTTSAISTVSTFEVADDPEGLCILCPDGTEFDQGGVGQHLLLTAGSEGFYVWYNSGSVATIHRIAGITADTGGDLSGLGFVLDSGSGIFNFWFDVSAIPEVTSIRTIADVGGALGGTFFKLDDISVSSEHYVWMSVSAIAEVTSIRTVADADGNLAGTFFKINDTADEHYVWMSVSAITETTRILMPSDAEGMASTAVDASFFQVRTANDAAAGSAFYIWYSIEGLPTDPAAGSGVGIEIDNLLSSDIAASIATQTASVINAFAFVGSTSFTAAASGDSVTLTQVQVGPVTPFASSGAAASDINTSVIVTTLSSGLATSIDPAPSVSGVGVRVTFDRDATATTVATQTGSFIGGCALVDLGVPVVSGIDVVVTVGSVGNTPDASDNNTTFTIATTTQGLASSVDPAPVVTGVGIQVLLNRDDTAATVATQVGSAIGLATEQNFTTPTVSGIEVLVTGSVVGNTPNASDNNTGFTIATLTEGIASSVDPAAGGSSVPVAISPNDTATTVANQLASVMGAANESGSFTTSVSGLTVCSININEGTSESPTSNTTGFSISVLLAGRNPNSDPVAASTSLEVAASRLSTSAEVCITTASVINADPTFTASVVGALVEVNSAESGVDITASAVTASGVGLENVAADFSIIFSNRNRNPDFDKETS